MPQVKTKHYSEQTQYMSIAISVIGLFVGVAFPISLIYTVSTSYPTGMSNEFIPIIMLLAIGGFVAQLPGIVILRKWLRLACFIIFLVAVGILPYMTMFVI